MALSCCSDLLVNPALLKLFGDIVVRHSGFSFSPGNQSAGLLLVEVGERLAPAKLGRWSINEVLLSMRQLHKLGVSHGDARLENIVRCRVGDHQFMCKWIDFHPVTNSMLDLHGVAADLSSIMDLRCFYHDWMCLLASISLRFDIPMDKVPSYFHEFVLEYVKNSDHEHSFEPLQERIMQVWFLSLSLSLFLSFLPMDARQIFFSHRSSKAE